MSTRPTIGIFGGTFDPIHVGHLLAAEAVRERCGLSRILFVVDNAPPHKGAARGASPRHRLRMTRLATRGNPAFRVLDLEIKRGGRSYTIDTVRAIRRRYAKQTKPALIIGADLANTIEIWKDWRELLRQVRLVVVGRSGEKTKQRYRKRIWRHVPLRCDLSSSEIRRKLRRRESVRYMVPDPVLRHIERCRLYRR